MITAITMEKAIQQLNCRETKINVVELFVSFVNEQMGTKDKMECHRCDAAYGHLYKVQKRMRATEDDCLTIAKMFLAAGWIDAVVSYKNKTITLTLSCDKPRGWQCVYEGKFIERNKAPVLTLIAA